MNNSKSTIKNFLMRNKQLDVEAGVCIWWRKIGQDIIRKSFVSSREDDLICIAREIDGEANIWLKLDEISIIKIKEIK